MKRTSAIARIVMVTVIALLSGALGCTKTPSPKPSVEAVQTTGPKLPTNAWQVPVDVNSNPTQNDYLNFGWQTMVAVSWPGLSSSSGGSLGQPDTNSTIGATASNGALVPTVWETYRNLSTVMLANGTDPGQQWNQPISVPGSCSAIGSNPVAPGFPPLFIDGSTFQQAPIVKDYINQATGNPLVDQEGWYTVTDIQIDQSEYAYIQQNGYFLGQNQAAAYQKSGHLQPFPRNGQGITPPLPSYAQYGALEVKSAWRVLEPSKDQQIIPRYFTQWGYFMQPDGKTCQGPTLFGLIGLHILRLTPSTGATWFWASFEQVDNVSAPSGMPATLATPGTPNGNCTSQYNVAPKLVTGNIPWNSSNAANNLCQVTTVPAGVQQVNQTWQQQLQGTVWQYYQMVNTLNPCAAGESPCYIFPPIKDPTNTVDTAVFANTAVESYFQTHSCMDCHGFGTGQGAPQPLTATNQIFTFVLQNAYNPSSSAKASRHNFLSLFRKPPSSKLLAKPEDKYKK
jgi:hypothetical protein